MTKKNLLPQDDPRNQRILDLEGSLARALADYANLEKRFAKESSAIIKFANQSLLEKLLEIRDHLGMAVNTIKDESLPMILGSLEKLLTSEGVTTIDTSGFFDPHSMECHEEASGEKDKIIKVIRPGYRLADRILRPARVIVGNGVTENPEPAEQVVGKGTVGADDHPPVITDKPN